MARGSRVLAGWTAAAILSLSLDRGLGVIAMHLPAPWSTSLDLQTPQTLLLVGLSLLACVLGSISATRWLSNARAERFPAMGLILAVLLMGGLPIVHAATHQGTQTVPSVADAGLAPSDRVVTTTGTLLALRGAPDVDVAVIVDPHRGPSQAEQAALQRFIADGGHLLVAGAGPVLDDLLAPYGLAVRAWPAWDLDAQARGAGTIRAEATLDDAGFHLNLTAPGLIQSVDRPGMETRVIARTMGAVWDSDADGQADGRDPAGRLPVGVEVRPAGTSGSLVVLSDPGFFTEPSVTGDGAQHGPFAEALIEAKLSPDGQLIQDFSTGPVGRHPVSYVLRGFHHVTGAPHLIAGVPASWWTGALGAILAGVVAMTLPRANQAPERDPAEVPPRADDLAAGHPATRDPA